MFYVPMIVEWIVMSVNKNHRYKAKHQKSKTCLQINCTWYALRNLSPLPYFCKCTYISSRLFHLAETTATILTYSFRLATFINLVIHARLCRLRVFRT